ncbi:MAG: hypothetical protein ACOX51_02195 [Myxococcota bacterium]|jgi:hypothetical protein|nr:hypothetical protein [Myxococcota bacterium]OQC40107.1 MAG: hypothetical protein BWX66_01061 [Deltaproteobacteria bacterium ADurb.Bin058]HHW97309.1 hypothetical protein [Oligoflexales bacterium]MBP8970503.1 hypothetical protein [Myxococcota bacterium]HOE81546.1 hypothetical protein [Myxococcota bacterium]
MRRFVALTLIFAFTSLGCYNTYYIDRGQLAELQVVPETGKATVTDSKSKAVQVDDDTKLFVRSEGGKRYQLTPFNFTMTESQLVASDRDYILDMTELKEMAEVDHMSRWKTGLLIGGGVAVFATIVGLIAWASATSGSSE